MLLQAMDSRGEAARDRSPRGRSVGRSASRASGISSSGFPSIPRELSAAGSRTRGRSLPARNSTTAHRPVSRPRPLGGEVDGHRPRILHKFQEFGVHPDSLHYSLFEKPNTVYCIFQVDFDVSRSLRTGYHQPSSLFYVGSTAVGAAKRHVNRVAVYRRLKRTEFVDAELSIRYWASHDNILQFALVPLHSCENYQSAWVAEHELIAQWQTTLNYPRATALIMKTSLGFRLSSKKRASMYGTFGLRLWRNLRKQMHRRSPKFFIKNSRELLDLAPEQPSKPRNFSGPDRQLTRKCMPSSSSVATSRIPTATEYKGCSRVWSSFAQRCTGPEHPDPWVYFHCVNRSSFRSVRHG